MSSDVDSSDERPEDAEAADAETDTAGTADTEAADAETERADLAAQVELLTEENRRLREEYAIARRRRNRLTALGLLVVGTLAVVGGVAFPDSRTVLFALGGTGLFAGVLTYFLTPERFVTADTGERVYAALAATGAELVAELGLRDARIYVPAQTDEVFADVRLFVPQHADYAIPDAERLDSLFVVSEHERERGVSTVPSGGSLYREFGTTMTETVAGPPGSVAGQMADALVEGFELAESATVDADSEAGRLTVGVAGGAFGTLDRFDHPVPSFFGVGLTSELGVPVTVDVTPSDGSAEYLVTCTWDPSEVEAVSSNRSGAE